MCYTCFTYPTKITLSEYNLHYGRGGKVGREHCKNMQRYNLLQYSNRSFLSFNYLTPIVSMCTTSFNILNKLHFSHRVYFVFLHGFITE
jgi:hypothetical protein